MKALNLIIDPKSYRDAFKFIQLRDGYFYATNGHIILKSPASEVLPADLLAELDGETYFEGTNWKDAKVVSMSFYKKVGDIYELFDNKSKSLGFLKPLTKEAFEKTTYGQRFPNCDDVIYKDDVPQTDLKEISINPELLDTLYKANGKSRLKLGFYGQNRGMKVTFMDSEAIGLLMPMDLF
jgi:hypothetical protein